MAFTEASRNEWCRYQPEWGGNRDVIETDPLILDIMFISHSRNLDYVENVKMSRGNRSAKKGEVKRLSHKKLKENVRIISGWYELEKDKKVPSTNINTFLAWAEQDFIDEIDDAMTKQEVLESGNPDLFKLKK